MNTVTDLTVVATQTLTTMATTLMPEGITSTTIQPEAEEEGLQL